MASGWNQWSHFVKKNHLTLGFHEEQITQKVPVKELTSLR